MLASCQPFAWLDELQLGTSSGRSNCWRRHSVILVSACAYMESGRCGWRLANGRYRDAPSMTSHHDSCFCQISQAPGFPRFHMLHSGSESDSCGRLGAQASICSMTSREPLLN